MVASGAKFFGFRQTNFSALSPKSFAVVCMCVNLVNYFWKSGMSNNKNRAARLDNNPSVAKAAAF